MLHVVPAVAPRYGGPSEAAVNLVRALEGAGLEPVLATTDADVRGRLPVPVGVEMNYRGVRTVFFPSYLGDSLKASPGMVRWFGRNVSEFDLVHVHSVFSHSCLAAGTAARRAAIPYIVRPLGQLDRWSLSQHRLRKRVFLALGGRRLLEGAAAIHWTDESERESASPLPFSRPGFVTQLGVDDELFSLPVDAAARTRVVLFLSRLHPKKNVEGLVEAFLSTRDAAPGWKLVVAGDGEPDYVRSLRDFVHRSGGKERVELRGWLTGAEKARALREASLLALPSRQENFGIVVAEAMAAATAVLVSDRVALSREVARAGAGWTFSLTGDGLRAALLEAMRSPGELRRRGEAGRALAGSRYRWNAVARRLVGEYARILGKDGRVE